MNTIIKITEFIYQAVKENNLHEDIFKLSIFLIGLISVVTMLFGAILMNVPMVVFGISAGLGALVTLIIVDY